MPSSVNFSRLAPRTLASRVCTTFLLARSMMEIVPSPAFPVHSSLPSGVMSKPSDPRPTAIYKERWQIELFFKALKQNLTVKTFVGTSENALRIQIWTALIALLLLKWLHHLSKANWSLSNLASMLRLNLFTYRELTQWIDNPMGTPPLIPVPPSNLPWLWYDLDRPRQFKPETSTQIVYWSASNPPVFSRPRYRSVLSWTAVGGITSGFHDVRSRPR